MKVKALVTIIEADDSSLLRFLAIQKYQDIVKSTGNEAIALEVLLSSLDLSKEDIK